MPELAVAERTLPHNLEAERSVLGAILLHNDAFNLAAEVIDARDFYRDAHRRIFDKMVKLVERGNAIDLVTLNEELGRAGELEEVGGPAYIAALVDGVPRSTNVAHYARIIKEKATLRSLISSANKILANAYEAEEDADAILDQAEHAIFAIADDKVRDGFVSLRDLAQSSLDTIEKLHARRELITGVPTGFTDLDEMTSGLQPADLVVVAYVQLMQARGRFENRTLELGSISRSLKGLAKELRVPIVLLSQLSRAPEARSDHRPQLSDLRESGALEQDADVVVFIYRQDMYGDKNEAADDRQGVAELIIAKQRNGPTGIVKLAFIREFTRFENLATG